MNNWQTIARQLGNDNIALQSALSCEIASSNLAIEEMETALIRMRAVKTNLTTIRDAYNKGYNMFNEMVKRKE